MIRSKLRDITIKRKLILIIMSTCVFVLALSGTAFIMSEKTILRHFIARNLLTQAEIVADNCKAALVFKEAKDAEEILKALRAESSIVSACIYTDGSEPFARYYRHDAGKDPHPTGLKGDGYFFKDGLLVAFKTVVLDGETIGTVCLRSDLGPMREMFKLHTCITMAVMLFASLTALLLSSLLQGVISKPILSLTDTARTVSEKGDYSTRALKRTNDEIGSLIDAFNKMLEQIQKRDMELVERTDELTTTNERLAREVGERKKAEEALYASHQIIEGIINAISVRVFWKDKNLVYLGCNAIFARDAGFTDAKDIVGKDDYQMGWRDQAELYRSVDRQVIESGRPKLLIEEPQTTPEGNTIALLTSKIPLCDSKGEIIGVIGTYVDITERKQAEETLRKSENKYKTLIENLPQKVFTKDRDSIYVSCNENYARDLGIRPEELKGKTDYDFFPKDLAEKYRRDDKRIMEAGKTESIEEKYIHQGQEMIIQTVKTPIKDEQGNISGVLGIFWDITDHKKIETALRKSEERFMQVVESAGDWIWEVDVEGLYTYASPIVERVLGYKPEDIVGKKHFYDFFTPDVKEELKKAAFKFFAEKKSFRGFVNANIHKNGSIVVVETSGAPIIDENGNLCGYRGADKDITERQQKEKELRKVHEELVSASHRAGMAEVAADVLHNVGNVLNSINVSATLITEKVKRSELANLQKVADIINEHLQEIGTFLNEHPQGKHIPVYLTEVYKCLHGEQADILSKLQVLTENVQHIKDIISMQQTYAKVSGVEMQTSLSRLVEDAIQINSAGLQRHGTRLVREFEELPDVGIDKQRLLQILVNLISNAKYALSDSKKRERLVTIRIYKHGENHLRIEVADNGCGIPQENLAKIFSHGFTTKEGGHGFGLHGSALAASEMGGSLTVHSDGIEQGATFTLELPFKPTKVLS